MINLDDTRAGKVDAYWIPNFNSLKRFGMLSCTWAFMASPPVDMSCILENAIYAQACAYAEVGKEIKQSSHCYNIFFPGTWFNVRLFESSKSGLKLLYFFSGWRGKLQGRGTPSNFGWYRNLRYVRPLL